MTQSDELMSHFRTKLPGYLDIHKKMVGINSFTANPEGVNKLGELTAEIFTGLGFSSETIQSASDKYGKHVFLRRAGTLGRQIGMVSHLDTVFSPEEETNNGFFWRIQDDRIYGPGSVDIKGGTVMILMVLEALQTFFPKQFQNISWLIGLDATEEVLSHDFGGLFMERMRGNPLACLVFEGGTPSGTSVPLVIARKGRAYFNLVVEGRSAHAGNRHAFGANAIVQMAHTIQEVAALTDYANEITFNVGTIKGGSVVNRVPHFAEAEVEMRTFSPVTFEQGVRNIQALAGVSTVSSQDGYPCRVAVNLLEETAPWPRNPGTDQLFNLWKDVGAELGYRIIPEERGGLSDGNLTWEAIPTLDGLGPTGNNAHCSECSPDGSKDQEYALLSSFVPKALLNTLAIARLAEQ